VGLQEGHPGRPRGHQVVFVDARERFSQGLQVLCRADLGSIFDLHDGRFWVVAVVQSERQKVRALKRRVADWLRLQPLERHRSPQAMGVEDARHDLPEVALSADGSLPRKARRQPRIRMRPGGLRGEVTHGDEPAHGLGEPGPLDGQPPVRHSKSFIQQRSAPGEP